MNKSFRNLMFIGVFLLFISHQSLTNGVAYDEKHKLFPEISTYDYGCVVRFPINEEYIYGGRWQRLGAVTLFSGVVLILSALFIRKRAGENLISKSTLVKS